MSSKTSRQINHYAEGSPDRREERDPRNPLRTSTMPVVFETSEIKTGDTGNIFMVNLKAEGDDNADAQDAVLTKSETAFVIQPDAAGETIMTTTRPVLIVEDTVELAEVIQATLEGMGLTAEYATHGEHGLEKLKRMHPQILLLDIGLPDITGWKMLDLIKEHYAQDAVAEPMPTVIVITAFGDPANRLIGKLQNIHSYLIKPFTPDQVENIVTMALEGKKPDNPEIGGEDPASS